MSTNRTHRALPRIFGTREQPPASRQGSLFEHNERMVVTLLASCVLLGLQTARPTDPVPAEYSPSAHVTYLRSQLEAARLAVRERESRKVTAAVASRRLGEILGQNSRLQVRLNRWITGPEASQTPAGKLFRLIRAQGLFDAYVATRLLELRGEAAAREEAQQLERRLARLLPEL